MKEAITVGLMNRARVESTVVSKSPSAATRQPLLEKCKHVAGCKILLPMVSMPGCAGIKRSHFCAY